MMDTNHPASTAPRRSRRDQLLLRAARVTIIVGVGVSALLTILASGPDPVRAAPPRSVAMDLIQDIREICQGLAFRDPDRKEGLDAQSKETIALYDDVDDLDGKLFMPPLDSHRRPTLHRRGWAQVVHVRNVDPDNLTRVVPKDTSKVKRVTVKAVYRGTEIAEASWLVFDLPQSH